MLRDDSQADLIPSMFISTSIAMIFVNLAGYGATLIDGIITSRALGHLAYSAISLLLPFTNIVVIISAATSVGAQIVISQAVGRGENDKANAAFTVSVIAGIVMSLLLVELTVLWPSELFRLCGITASSHSEIYSHMSDYLKGYIPGIPFVMMVQIIGPVIVIDGGKALFTFSAFLFAGLNIAGDWLNGYVFHCGNFGMGLATSASYIVQFLVLMPHFMKRDSYFRTSLKGFEFSQVTDMMKAASPMFVLRFAAVLRKMAINRINIYVALSAMAIAARGIQNDIYMVIACFPMGIVKALLTMSAMFYGASDRRGLTHLLSCSMKMNVIICAAISVIIYFGAEWIAECFTKEPGIIELSAFSIRCMSVALIPESVSVLFQHYLQGINESKLANIINFVNGFFIPFITALVMGYYFGSKGVMASIAVADFILLVFIAAVVFIRTGSLRNFTLLPEGFGGTNADNVYASITSSDDVMRESKRAEIFCLEHGMSGRDSRFMALFVEETAGNIISHGKPKLWHKLRADYRLSYSDGKICMTLRDYCEYFDPSAFFNANSNESPEHLMGINIIMGLADDVRYFNALNSNNIMIYIDTKKGASANEGNQH